MSASVIDRFFANAGMIAMRAACNAQSRLHRRYEGFSSFHVEANAARRCGRKWPTLATTSESAYSKPARKRRHVGSARSDDARKIAGRERRRSERIGGQMQLEVSFEGNEIYEWGGVLLTLLACPKELDKPRSLDRFLSLCGKALWLKHLASPDDLSPITVRPPYG